MADCRLPEQIPRRYYRSVTRGAQAPNRKFFTPSWKNVFDIKVWAPLGKLFPYFDTFHLIHDDWTWKRWKGLGKKKCQAPQEGAA